MDLATMSFAELKELAHALPKEIQRREELEKRALLAEFEQLASSRGFSLSDVLGASAAKSPKKITVSVKYRHPENPALAWTGRGRKPQWVQDYLAAGNSIESLAV